MELSEISSAQPKFNTLDYALLKRNGRTWELFQYSRETSEYYIMTNEIWVQKSSSKIVPYNDSTKHLLGTNLDAI